MKRNGLYADIVIHLLVLEELGFLVLTKMSQLIKVSKITRLKSVTLTFIWNVPEVFFFFSANIIQIDVIFRIR